MPNCLIRLGLIAIAAVFLILQEVLPVMADEAQVCHKIQSAKDLVACAAVNNSELYEFLEVKVAAKNLAELAGQRPNPELESELWRNMEEGRQSHELTVKILHILERKRKLEARKKLARARQEYVANKYKLAYMESVGSMLIKLYQLLSLQDEIEVLNDMTRSYRSMSQTLQKSQALSPEIRTSLEIFAIIQRENQAKLLEKKDELAELKSQFAMYIPDAVQIEKLLPQSWPDWPSLDSKFKSYQNSPWLDLRTSSVALSEAELALEKSESYQNIKLGPMASVEHRENTLSWGIGIALSMELPLFHRNEAGIQNAANKLSLQKTLYGKYEAQLKREYVALHDRYEALRKELLELSKAEWLESKHMQLHAEMQKGLIHISLIIDGHEQYLAMVERRNALRIKLIEVLTKIYLLKNDDILELLP